MPLFCPAQGLEVFCKPEWINQQVSRTFESNFWIIGGKILYSRPKGFGDLEGVRRSLELNDRVAESISGGRGPYVQIEDYSQLDGASTEARKFFLNSLNDNTRREVIIVCNMSLPLTIAAKLGRRFNTTDKDIHFKKNYDDAIGKALAFCSGDLPGADSTIMNILHQYGSQSRSLAPVDIFSKSHWDIRTPEFSNRLMLVDQCILHSTSKGFFRSEHVPVMENFRRQCQMDLPPGFQNRIHRNRCQRSERRQQPLTQTIHAFPESVACRAALPDVHPV